MQPEELFRKIVEEHVVVIPKSAFKEITSRYAPYTEELPKQTGPVTDEEKRTYNFVRQFMFFYDRAYDDSLDANLQVQEKPDGSYLITLYPTNSIN